MGLKVFKFGGSSVADASAISHVCQIIAQNPKKLAVVVSAMGGVTDSLLGLAERAMSGKRQDEDSIISSLNKQHLEASKILISSEELRASYAKSVGEKLEELKKMLDGVGVL